MVTFLFGVITVCFTLMLLIGFHEFGHCYVAKKCGIPVERFAIGFGKILWRTKKTKKNKTEYAICALPLGGYVKFKENGSFEKAPIYKRLLVILAGPVFNLILAFFAYWLVFMIGITQPLPVVGKIIPQSPAALSHLPAHSQILSVDNHPTNTWVAVAFRLLPHLGESNQVSIQTQKNNYQIPLKNWQLNSLKPNLLSSFGIVPTTDPRLFTRQYSVFKSIPAAFNEVRLYLYLNSVVIEKMVTGHLSLKSLMGPLGLLAGTFYASQHGLVMYLAFVGFISVGLAFVNLLPIPGLDGANVVYLAIEFFRGKPLSMAIQMLLFRLGVILLVCLMIQALMNDVLRLF